MPKRFCIIFLMALTGCSAVGELAYDTAAARQMSTCEQYPDRDTYRACRERVRAAEDQARNSRKAN